MPRLPDTAAGGPAVGSMQETVSLIRGSRLSLLIDDGIIRAFDQGSRGVQYAVIA